MKKIMGKKGSDRVSRGGGWSYYALCCRSADCDCCGPGDRYHFLGFRPARNVKETEDEEDNGE